MKKLTALSTRLTGALGATAGYLSLTTPSFAASLCPGADPGTVDPGFGGLCALTFEGGILGRVITLIFIIAIVIALIFLIWGGIRWILSGGDKGKVDTARQTIIAAVIGLVVIFLSYFILNFVVRIFVPGFDVGNFDVPNITAQPNS